MQFDAICVSKIIACVSKVIQRNNFDGRRDYCASRRAYLVDKTTKLYKLFIPFFDGRRDYLASRVSQQMVQIWQKIAKIFLA